MYRNKYRIRNSCDSYSRIESFLYIGDHSSATDEEFIRENGVRRIITLGTKPIDRTAHPEDMQYLHIDVKDTPDTYLMNHFNDCYHFISNGQSKYETVLVHCTMGVSRSATIVIAFLMKKYDISLSEAMELVKDMREKVNPNPGFIAQLELYEVLKDLPELVVIESDTDDDNDRNNN